jgi:Xaa-Pro aminopeptidase
MVCNLEPAVYLENTGGLRHCDMVAVSDQGVELLTPFQATLAELTVGAR